MYTINSDFTIGFIQSIESGTPTWPPIRMEWRERAQRVGSAGAARAQRREQTGTAGTQPLGAPCGVM